jgi:thiamine-monophosphate kinase
LSLSEFDIIGKYFNQPGLIPEPGNTTIPLAIGDDCALLDIPAGKQLAVSMDTLLADLHFFSNDDPALIAQRALAVNLSDLAAMGAVPLAFTLGLSLPRAEDSWLKGFSEGLRHAVSRYQCPLIGGDITRGNLAITIQVHGLVDRGAAIRRSQARVGDTVYVSGELGAAGLAVGLLRNGMSLNKPDRHELHQAYYDPQPQLELGRICVGKVSAAIDISDGLLADAGHIARQSGVGMELEARAIPVAKAVKRFLGGLGDNSGGVKHALSAGDDYQLLLTVKSEQEVQLQKEAEASKIKLTRIGKVIKGSRVRCLDTAGEEIVLMRAGFQHFS